MRLPHPDQVAPHEGAGRGLKQHQHPGTLAEYSVAPHEGAGRGLKHMQQIPDVNCRTSPRTKVPYSVWDFIKRNPDKVYKRS
jgi:hypothetical protein